VTVVAHNPLRENRVAKRIADFNISRAEETHQLWREFRRCLALRQRKIRINNLLPECFIHITPFRETRLSNPYSHEINKVLIWLNKRVYYISIYLLLPPQPVIIF